MINKMYYHEDTPEAVIRILESCLHEEDQRVRIFYGDTKTGRDWMEEWMVCGTIGCSTGPHYIPILINNRRSMGGPAILDHCIVRLMVNGSELYRHPKYNQPELTIGPVVNEGYQSAAYEDGKLCAQFRTPQGAARWIEFMQGKRLCK